MFSTQTQKTIFYTGSYNGYTSNINTIIGSSMGGICSGGGGGGGGGYGGGSGGGGGGGSGNPGDYTLLNFYTQLSVIVNTLNDLLTNYSVGDIDYVITNFNKTTFYNLTMKLAKIKQNPSLYPEFENMRTSVEKTLQGLYKSIYVYLDLESTQRELVACKEKESILYDVEKLKQYIGSLSGSISLFPDIEVTSIGATLKPEVAEYIKLFGVPQNGIFETDKMAVALKNIGYDDDCI